MWPAVSRYRPHSWRQTRKTAACSPARPIIPPASGAAGAPRNRLASRYSRRSHCRASRRSSQRARRRRDRATARSRRRLVERPIGHCAVGRPLRDRRGDPRWPIKRVEHERAEQRTNQPGMLARRGDRQKQLFCWRPAPKFAVDGQVEQRTVTHAAFAIEEEADGPDLLLSQRALRSHDRRHSKLCALAPQHQVESFPCPDFIGHDWPLKTRMLIGGSWAGCRLSDLRRKLR